jgi:hypothetical protein
MYKRTTLETTCFKVVMVINLSEAYARVVLGWVTFWEVWFKGAKSRQYCVVGSETLHWLQKYFYIQLYTLLLLTEVNRNYKVNYL